MTEVVDFYHATQHLYQVVEEVKGWTDRERKKWISGSLRLLRHGRIDELIARISELCRGRNWGMLDDACNVNVPVRGGCPPHRASGRGRRAVRLHVPPRITS
ncbi:MAG: hypothetical protein ACYCW6_29260 [Candidatus Xenobia bacterium]